jgi:uncharacterized integral membrane protein
LKHALWLLRWILKAAIFFTLFAFALNNQQEASVNLFFGLSWHAPLVLIVLVVFTIGLIVGVLAMVPRWWRARKIARSPKAQELYTQSNNQTTGFTLNPSAVGTNPNLSTNKLNSDNLDTSSVAPNTLRDLRMPGS